MPSISNADQGLKMSCLNMKSVFGRNYDPLKFTLQAVGLQYFDEEKGDFVMIKSNKLDIGEDQVTARFADYELGFQMIVFEGDTEPTMTLSKYDYKNKKFLEHYKCDVEFTNID
ncbi:hypothetical protein OAB97_02885 [Candidatus Pelagibacter sp.]|jgi:hypothetical protein|nr:hypothetical protein [Candidatus Pelagibacter sp.]|tara:strand:- start:58 stop:399 length:342 start_codon:yes stop_codon:yes gene_type:complete